jgi:hypothetical protein
MRAQLRAGVAQSLHRRATGLKVRDRFPAEASNCSLTQPRIQWLSVAVSLGGGGVAGG